MKSGTNGCSSHAKRNCQYIFTLHEIAWADAFFESMHLIMIAQGMRLSSHAGTHAHTPSFFIDTLIFAPEFSTFIIQFYNV